MMPCGISKISVEMINSCVMLPNLYSSRKLAMNLTERGLHAEPCPNTDTILDKLLLILQENDVVAILSYGDFDNIHMKLLENCKQLKDTL